MPEDRIDHPALRERPVSRSATAETVPSTTRIGGVLAETVVTLGEIARRYVPAVNGRRPNPTTIWRWATSGVRRPDGGLVTLESAWLGKKRVSSVEALGRFLAALQEPPAPSPAPRPPSERQRAAKRAAHELEKAGW